MPYNPFLSNPYGQYYPQNQPLQIQSSGLVSVRNIDEAMNYPVEPGKSITFKDETAPYIYTKTMGFSQLDRPIFEKYRLIKEETHEPVLDTDYVSKSDYDSIKADIEGLKKDLDLVKDQITKRRAKKEGEE